MDDGVLVEPALGARPWLSVWIFDSMSKLPLGGSAINLEKLAEEGEFSTGKLIWGLLFRLKDADGRFKRKAAARAARACVLAGRCIAAGLGTR